MGAAFFFLSFEMGSHYVAQAGLKLPGSNSPPASAFRGAATTGVWHGTLLEYHKVQTWLCLSLVTPVPSPLDLSWIPLPSKASGSAGSISPRATCLLVLLSFPMSTPSE
jgi:hypothetical protein